MNAVVTQKTPSSSVLVRIGQRYGIDPDKMLVTLKATAFKGDATVEQMMALLVVADQHQLNPWTKEIYAFPSRAGIVPIVGVDGWARIINENPAFDGMDFNEGSLNESRIPEWIECRIYRKDRSHPISVKEYLAEVRRDTDPWKTHPRRMLRHKAMIQCARIAFGFAGIYDEDEAANIIDASPERPGLTADPRPDTSSVDPVKLDEAVERLRDILLVKDLDEDAQCLEIFDLSETIKADEAFYSAFYDAIKTRGLITKSNWNKSVERGAELAKKII